MSTVPSQDSCDSLDSHDSLESYDSMDSYESSDSYRSDDLMEAPTLSSKEIKQAREQALKVLESEPPEEAGKIFTEGSELNKVDNQLREKVEAAAPKPPPKAAVGKSGVAVQPPPKN